MSILKTSLPQESILSRDQTRYDYQDSFQSSFWDKQGKTNSTSIGKAFFTSSPKWVGKLFQLRNRLVAALGLKTSGNVPDREKQLELFKCEPGERLGLFKVFHKSAKEVVFGEDDKHLNFRVSLYCDHQPNGEGKKELTISTTVVFHNWLGKLYFVPVKPFHSLIVPAMLKGIVSQLENK